MKTKFLLFVLLFSVLFAQPQTVFAAPSDNPKRILVLYKERDPDHKGIVQLFTGFLKEAGYAFDTADVEKLLIEKPDMQAYSGIMTTYQTSQMVGGDLYPRWLVEQMEAGRRILILGSYGAYQAMIKKEDGSFIEWNESTQTINTFFHPFGLEFFFAFTGDTERLEIIERDKEFAQFQVPVTAKDLNYYQLYKSVNPQNKVFFGLKRKDMLDSESALNVITPFGGMILEGYAYYWDPELKKTIYRVNFPQFIKEVFSASSPPVPKFKVKSHAELVQNFPLPERPPQITDPKKRPTEISRRILVLYKRSESETLEQLPFYNRAALVLEYLGLIPVYHAVEDGLPDDKFMDNFYGIATWHTKTHMVQAQAYGDWLTRQIKQGKRVAMLQEYGASYDLETEAPVTNQGQVMEALGIRFEKRGEKRNESLPVLRILDPKMLGFERPFDASIITYTNSYTSMDPENKVFLSFDDEEFGQIDLGVITQQGGISLEETPFYFPSHDASRIELIRRALKNEVAPEIAEQETLGAWFLDPYRFFSEAFALNRYPAPDTTTLNGSRIFYAHIDGDGLASISLIDGANLAGFMVYDGILKEYKDIPTSVSVITKFVERIGNEYHHPALVLARNIFSLPNVDMAVHAATHPFDWVGGDPYIINPDSYPYKIGYKAHDLLEEIWGAKLFADHNLAPADKKVTSLFWSGATNPDEKALEIVWRSGLHNLNGGDPRHDADYPSIAGLTPYTLPYGPYRQFLTSAQNDYIYTLFLTGDWGGQKKVLQHFDKTGSPYRVYPMNLYYHFYSGIKNESMNALRFVYDYVRSIDAASIFATQYLEIAEDFYQTRIGFDKGAYWVENNGKLRTIRFDDQLHIDVAASEGVIGYSFNQGQTYVHLDGRKRRLIVLADAAPKIPYFIQATQFVDESHFDGRNLDFSYRGFGKTVIKIGGLKANTNYHLSLKASDRKEITAVLNSDANGTLEYRTLLTAPSTRYQGRLQP